jgi:hypothetical protein
METAPKDKEILLYGDGGWYQGSWDNDMNMWRDKTLLFHGCGCCESSPSPPEGWVSLPSTTIDNDP